jgi:hypothetical protein
MISAPPYPLAPMTAALNRFMVAKVASLARAWTVKTARTGRDIHPIAAGGGAMRGAKDRPPARLGVGCVAILCAPPCVRRGDRYPLPE